ncbi:MAG: PAS domain S-box protein [Nitrospirae bacterium]|nr:PAS domain S-box protein [Nitrospirota bacterium]
MNRLTPFRIVFFYILAGGLWILFSDKLLASLTRDPDKLILIQTYKGLFYIALTAALLFVLIRRYSRQQKEIEAALRTAVDRTIEERSRADAIVAAIGDGISIQDTDFKIIYQNEAQKRIVGDHLGEYCYMAYEKREKACEGCPVGLSFADGGIHTVERSAPTERGLIHVEITASPLRDATGKIIAGIEAVRDITERKKNLEDLRAMNERMNAILQTSPEAIMTLTPEGIVTLWNKAAEKIFGWTADEVIGKFYPLVPENKLAEFQATVKRMMQGESFFDREFMRQKKDGSPVVISLSGAPLRDADGRIVSLIGVLSDITERKWMEEALKKSAKDYRLLFDSNPHPMWVYDLETLSFLAVNDAAVKHYGYTKDEFLHMTIKDIRPPEDVPALLENISRVTEGMNEAGIWRHRKKDNSIIYVEIMSHTLDFSGRQSKVVLASDLTERMKLEEQLRHAQKMEAVGQLAGGIAHDFNNILTAIIGYGNLLRMKMREDDPLRIDADEILKAAEKAATLTQSLLAFSRKQIISLKAVDLNEIVRRVEKLLLRVMGEDIELKSDLAKENLTVLADSSQIEQVLINLATNARDAMPGAGMFIIETELVMLDREFLHAHGYGKPGLYALLSVDDTGEGMDESTRQKIFEPFFTTKEVGKGTGLGLSIVYGIVKQHNGYINVYSEIGKGTTFRIYLPIVEAEISELKPPEPAVARRGTETVLVAEDDETLRKLVSSVLQNFGYSVIIAADGAEAVAKFMADQDRIQLLILDVVMPKKNGREAFEEIKAIQPDVRVLFTSGYTANIIHKKGIIEAGLNFIHKPVSPNELLIKVREILDQ